MLLVFIIFFGFLKQTKNIIIHMIGSIIGSIIVKKFTIFLGMIFLNDKMRKVKNEHGEIAH